jgi:hypothetical protein
MTCERVGVQRASTSPGCGHRTIASDYDVTQHRTHEGRWKTSVGLSRWGVDIHGVKRVVVQSNGTVKITNAGGHDTMRAKDPKEATALVEVPYEAIIPRANDTSNLLVPVCASFSHVGFSTFRLEPQYAIFGQAAGTAAALAAKEGITVQEVDVGRLQQVLVAAGQLIYVGQTPPASPPRTSFGNLA